MIDIIISIVGSLIVGYALAYLGLKHSLKIEKIRRLAPFLEQVYPIIRNLNLDFKFYLEKLQVRGNENSHHILRIQQTLEEFEVWYNVFRQKGMEPELESLNEELYRLLLGLSVHSQLSLKYGIDYISQRLELLSSLGLRCQKSLEKLLRG